MLIFEKKLDTFENYTLLEENTDIKEFKTFPEGYYPTELKKNGKYYLLLCRNYFYLCGSYFYKKGNKKTTKKISVVFK